MGNYHAAKDRVAMPKGTAQIIGVADLEEACAVAKALCAEGVGCIELPNKDIPFLREKMLLMYANPLTNYLATRTDNPK